MTINAHSHYGSPALGTDRNNSPEGLRLPDGDGLPEGLVLGLPEGLELGLPEGLELGLPEGLELGLGLPEGVTLGTLVEVEGATALVLA